MTDEQKLYDQAEMLAFLNDPEERKNAVSLALQIQEVCGKNWFNFDRFLQKTGEQPKSGELKINLCKMFGLIKIKANMKGRTQFKVTVSNNDKIAAIDEVIDYYREEIKQLEIQKAQLVPEPVEVDENTISSAIKP